MIRQTSVAGSFYPDNQEELERYFKYFTKIYDENFSLPNIKTRAVIVPHAGYIYSGFSANVAYRLLQKSGVKKFIIIGPSHKVAFRGSSICEFERYQTPLGDIKFSKKIYNL
jgi:AmmeMemoRadiSam system protein B